MNYPKIMPRMITKYEVEENQAKTAWLFACFMATLLMSQHDHKYKLEMFESRLQVYSAANKLNQLFYSPEQYKKFKLEFGM